MKNYTRRKDGLDQTCFPNLLIINTSGTHFWITFSFTMLKADKMNIAVVATCREGV